MRNVKTKPKDGIIGAEQASKARKISQWVLQKAKIRESKVVSTQYSAVIKGKEIAVSFSGENHLEKLETFCADNGFDVHLFRKLSKI